jgi:hypothetical protein
MKRLAAIGGLLIELHAKYSPAMGSDYHDE